MTITSSTSFTVGSYTVIPEDHSVQSEQGDIELLQPKFIEVLAYLAQNYPNLVSRDELIENIWDGNSYVGEKALTNAVWHIRQKLHQNDDEYIQTVRKGGYRLLHQPHYLTSEQLVGVKSSQLSEQLPEQFNEYRSEHSGKESSNNHNTSIHHSIKQLGWRLTTIALIIVIALSWSYTYWHSAPSSVPKITSLTSLPGRAIYPATSPDGRYLVYYWKQANSAPDLYLKDLSQPSLAPEQLTFDTDRESKPVWGKLGKFIYFVQKSWQKDRCHIVKLDLQTKGQTKLASCKPQVNGAISISNNGQLLAFNGIDTNNEDVGIYLLDLTSKNARPERISCQTNCEYSDRDAVFSPDDRILAFTRRAQPYEEDIFLYDRINNQAERLTTGQTDIHGMAWHPSGQHIVYSAEIANQRDGYILDIKTSEVSKLNVPGFSFPSFVANTSRVVYHDWQLNSFIGSLSLAEQVLSVPFPILQSRFNYKDVDFSEQRQQITYVSNESGNNEIWFADSDGTNRKQLTNLAKNVSVPRWSHQGDKIAFLVRDKASARNAVYVIDIKTKQVTRINSRLNSFGTPSWMLEDRSLLVEAFDDASEKAQLYRLTLDGQAEVLIEVEGIYAVQSSVNEIWYSVDDQGLYRLSIKDIPNQLESSADIKQAELIISGEQLASDYSWLVSGNYIYFLQNFANHQEVVLFDLSSNTKQTLLKMPLRTLDRNTPLSINQQQQQLIFSQSQSMNVDIKMLEHPLLSQYE
ncbi:DPP IV N-terminal domain-containing protein [Thalassotalea montiporae]